MYDKNKNNIYYIYTLIYYGIINMCYVALKILKFNQF